MKDVAKATRRQMAGAVSVVGLVCSLTLTASAAAADDKRTRMDPGLREYSQNCAACHGPAGKGNGPVAGFLTRNPPDITLLSKGNGGVFPISRLYEVIDGRGVASHGTREMPIWGRDYRIQDAEYYGEVSYDADALVRARILALLEYINRLQAK